MAKVRQTYPAKGRSAGVAFDTDTFEVMLVIFGPTVLFLTLLIVALWRMGTAQHRIADQLQRLHVEVGRLGHPGGELRPANDPVESRTEAPVASRTTDAAAKPLPKGTLMLMAGVFAFILAAVLFGAFGLLGALVALVVGVALVAVGLVQMGRK